MASAAPTNKEFLQEKFFSFPITLLIIALLTPPGVADAYLILGHAHFMMTALYQYKMGRITPKSFVFYLAAFAAVFYIAYLFPRAFTLFVSAFLLFHVYTGEVRHIKRGFSAPYLLMTLSILLLLCSWLAIELWLLPISIPAVLIGSIVLACLAVVLFVRQEGVVIEYFFLTLLVLLAAFVLLELFGMRPMSVESFGFIVIAHYLATYFNVFRSFTRKGQGKQWPFVWESIGMNLLFLAGYIAIFYYFGTDNVVYAYVYHPISFYVWTLMHFLTTMNFKGYYQTVVSAVQKIRS